MSEKILPLDFEKPIMAMEEKIEELMRLSRENRQLRRKRDVAESPGLVPRRDPSDFIRVFLWQLSAALAHHNEANIVTETIYG